MILAGDFYVKFLVPEAETLLTFLKNKFRLEVINGRNDPTTKGVLPFIYFFESQPSCLLFKALVIFVFHIANEIEH